MNQLEPIVWRHDLQADLKLSRETMRRWLASGKLPKLDHNITPKQQGWNVSTLVAAGFKIPAK